MPAELIPELCAESFRVLKPGGLAAVHDFMVSDDRTGPTLAALWQLQHMVYTPDGLGLTPGHVQTVLEASGFKVKPAEDLILGMTQVLVGRKPVK